MPKYYYVIKNVILFPFRMVLAVTWFLFTVVLGGLGFPGCAPIIMGERYILLLNRKWIGGYRVALYDLLTESSALIYDGNLPIEKCRLLENELVCSYFLKGDIHFAIIGIESKSVRYASGYSTVNHRCYDLLPNDVGAISVRKVCVEGSCYEQVVMVTESYSNVLKTEVRENILLPPSISRDARYISYCTQTGLYICDVLTGEQRFYSEGESYAYNWDDVGNLLVYNIRRNCFLVFDPKKSISRGIDLPAEFRNENQHITSAAISPKGNFIAYGIVRKNHSGVRDTYLILHSMNTSDHKIIGKKARIYDIGWSESEKLISVAGVNKRDLLEIGFGYKMRHPANHDKEVMDIQGNLVLAVG